MGESAREKKEGATFAISDWISCLCDPLAQKVTEREREREREREGERDGGRVRERERERGGSHLRHL